MATKLDKQIDLARKRLGELIARRRAFERTEKQRKRKERSAAERRKLKARLKTYGGRERFIRKWGDGQIRDPGPPAPDQCSWHWVHALFEKECKMLGVLPTISVHRCDFKGKHEVDGRRLCGTHVKLYRSAWRDSCTYEHALEAAQQMQKEYIQPPKSPEPPVSQSPPPARRRRSGDFDETDMSIPADEWMWKRNVQVAEAEGPAETSPS